MFIFALLKFLLFLFFFLILPSKLIFKTLKINIEDKITDFGITIIFGVVLITLLTAILRFLGISKFILWFIILIPLFVYLLSFKNSLNLRSSIILMNNWSKNLVVILVLTIGVLSQNLVLFRGGWQVGSGFVFPSLHDTMWNISLVAELSNRFPPENPAIAGIPLKNNHYFYPLFLATTRYLTDMNIFDLYFRFGPIFISLLFGLGLYSISSIFTKNFIFRGLTVFLGYFSGNFAFLLPFFLGKNFDWKGNTFFADQPFDQIINPYSVLGFAITLFGVFCFYQITKKNKFFWGYTLIGGLLFGSLYGYKSFGGVIVILSLLVFTVLHFILKRQLTHLPITIITLLISTSIFLLTTDINSASLIWAPGWLLTQMMTDKDKLNLPQFADLENYYKLTGNYLGLLKIKSIELIIYLIGNLGARIVGFIYLIYILLVSYVRSQKYIIRFIGILVLISLAIPLLFNLRNSTFNIIQFTPYALVLLAIISVILLERIYYLLFLRQKKLFAIIIILVFIILSVPVNVKNIIDKFEMPKNMITNEEMEALNFLNKNLSIRDTILIDPDQFPDDPIYISALSEKRIFLSSPSYAMQTGLNPSKHVQEINEFFQEGDRNFLTKNNISYIYLLKKNSANREPIGIQKIAKKAVFENKRVIIWKMI